MTAKQVHTRGRDADGAAANGRTANGRTARASAGSAGRETAIVIPPEADALLDSLLADAKIAAESARAAAAAAESLAAEMRSMRLQRRKAFAAMKHPGSGKARG